jgi:hypothetical protein
VGLDDVVDTVVGGTVWGLSAAALAGTALLLGKGGRPLVKQAVKGYLVASARGRELAAEAVERLRELTAEASEQLADIYAEARAELEPLAADSEPASPPPVQLHPREAEA